MTAQRLPRFRPRTRRRLVAGALATVAVAGLVVVWVQTTKPPPASRPGALGHGSHRTAGAGRSSTHHLQAKDAQTPPLGIYVGPGNASAAEAVASQLGGRVPYAMDFLPQTSWAALTSPTWLAAHWHGSPFDLVIGVPMLPASGGTLAQGASGSFDPEFQVLAQRLVQDGLGDAILMLGYQPDDSGTPWFVASKADATDYVRYWDAIRSTMDAVAGANFLFEWDAGDGGTSPLSPAAMYPGNTAVDMVATDAFDLVGSDPATGGHWSSVLHERFGPAWMATFAASHHKPMALAMWGEVTSSVGGAGDAPAYVSQLLSWAASERLAMCVLWDYQGMTLTGGAFPGADAALRKAVAAPSEPAQPSVPPAGAERRPAGRPSGS